MAKLTKKQEAFAQAILTEESQSEAYRSVYSAKRMSDKQVWEEASKLVSNPKVAQRIAQLKEERNKRCAVDADYVLKRLVEIDQLDVLDILDENLESFKPISEWPKAWRQSITGLDLKKMIQYGKDSDDDEVSILQKVKWPDKVKNLELLGKHVDVQAFKEKVDIEATQTHNVMLVPSCTNVDDWEAQAQQQQSEILGDK